MAEQFNPLDPLGIFGLVKKDVDRIATQAKLPPLRFRGNPGGKSRFIGGCKVRELLMDEHEGLCLTHGFAVSKTVRCPRSELTDEEWQTVWELAGEAFPHGQGNPRIDEWWPETMDEVERAVSNYAIALRGAARKYAERAREAAARYSESAEKAIYHYRQYTLSEYYKGYPARI
ncbi:unnamed protein product [marine sediment metagenome]|uniref:Uncharacterized protein n=1 Tax=marine sediment metagenome TaxID=412755 RepID=X1STP5_9ZZZZ